MNEPAAATLRDDDYVQDLASQWVAELVGAQPGERIADVCAAPGGKATWMAAQGAWIAAMDVRAARASLVVDNARRLERSGVVTLVGDARRPPFRRGSFDRVLVDAPCSGLGTLRRRADARWRIDAASVDRLAELQRELVDAALELVRPGGVLVYSVCTLTEHESLGIDEHLAQACPGLEPLAAAGRTVAAVGERGAAPAAGRRDRRHVRPPRARAPE